MTAENTTVRALAGRVGRHSAIYVVGIVLTVIAGLATLAVFTRLMAPSEFGVMVVLIVIAGGLRRLYTLAVMQGTIALVFGGGEEDSDMNLTEDVEPVSNKREVLGTGLVLAAGFAGAGTVILWLFAPELARLLFDTTDRTEGVRLAAVAAALDGVGNLLLMVPRFERRPKAYVAFNIVSPIVALAAGIPLVAGGAGAEGALLGIVVGSASAVTLLLVLLRTRYRLCFQAARALKILKTGVMIVPLLLALYVISHGGIVVLARSDVAPREVGLYAVALMFGSVILRLNAVFFMAWLPMKRTSLFFSVHKQRGHGWMYSTLTTYLILGLCAAFVVLTAAAGALIEIVGPGYADAEDLIMLLGLAALAQSVFVLSYRVSTFPRKRVVLALVATCAAVIFVSSAIALVELVGVKGVPLAAIATFGCASVVMPAFNQRGPSPIPFQYGRLLRIALATSICLGGHTLLREEAGGLRPLLDVGVVVLFGLLVIGMRVASFGQIRALAATAGDIVRVRRRHDPAMAARLAALAPAQAQALERAAGPSRAGGGESPPAPEPFVRALRLAGDIGEPTPRDEAIGRYLLSERPRAERDEMARALWRVDVAPTELHLLEEAFEMLRRLPRSAWHAVRRPSASGSAPGGPVRGEPVSGAASVHPSPGVACDLPGRDHDLAQLLDAYAAIAHGPGAGQTVFLTGAVGSGRTTLLHAVAAGVQRIDPAPMVLGGGFHGGRFVAWEHGAIGEDVIALLSDAVEPADGLAPFAEFVAQTVSKGVGTLGLARELADPSERLDPAKLLVRLLRAMCEQAPVVCLVDDADDAPGGLWGDVLLELAESVAHDLPLLLVLAIDRPAQLDEHEDDEPDSLYVARRLCADGLAGWHPLGAVSITDLERWTGPAAPEVLHQLLALVVGRAAWAAQLWRHWQPQSVVVWQEGADAGWRFGLNGRVRAMNPIDDILGDRLRQRFGSDKATLGRERTLLAFAALEGHVFTADAVAVALDRSEEELVDLFDDTLALDGEHVDGVVCPDELVVLDDPSGWRHLLRYRFASELDWLMLYDHGLKDSRRRAAAQTLARALVATYAGHTQRVAHVLTRLFETAHDPHSARRFRRIHDAGASRAVTLWRAHAILDEPDPVDRYARRRKSQILLAGAAELLRSDEWDTGLRLAEAAYRLAPLRFDQADALYLSGAFHLEAADAELARRKLMMAAELRREIADRRGEADARAVLAVIDGRDGRPERARLELTTTLDIYRGLGDRQAEADVLRRIAGIDVESGAVHEAHAGFIEAASLYREVGDRAGEADARHNLARIDLAQGADESARAQLRRALDLYVELDDRHSEAATRFGLAGIDTDQGETADARDELWRVVDLGYDLQDDDVVTAGLDALEAMDRAQSG